VPSALRIGRSSASRPQYLLVAGASTPTRVRLAEGGLAGEGRLNFPGEPLERLDAAGAVEQHVLGAHVTQRLELHRDLVRRAVERAGLGRLHRLRVVMIVDSFFPSGRCARSCTRLRAAMRVSRAFWRSAALVATLIERVTATFIGSNRRLRASTSALKRATRSPICSMDANWSSSGL